MLTIEQLEVANRKLTKQLEVANRKLTNANHQKQASQKAARVTHVDLPHYLLTPN
jgi:FKBP-type peptidyl-prolyl cis-trans isomerase (trigger factor)